MNPPHNYYRTPPERLNSSKRARVIFFGGHHAGENALLGLAHPCSVARRFCDVVAVVPDLPYPVHSDTWLRYGLGSLWEYDLKGDITKFPINQQLNGRFRRRHYKRSWRAKLVPNLAKELGLQVHYVDPYPGSKANDAVCRIIRDTGADCLISCTTRLIFRAEAIGLVTQDRRPRAFNIHPSGIPSFKNGKELLQWPQPRFQGKRAFVLMWEMSRAFHRRESRYDCRFMEWVIHRISPPPFVDAGEFMIASKRIPVPSPTQDLPGRVRALNDGQKGCAGHLPSFIDQIAEFLLIGGPAPWNDPRAEK